METVGDALRHDRLGQHDGAALYGSPDQHLRVLLLQTLSDGYHSRAVGGVPDIADIATEWVIGFDDNIPPRE